MTRLSAAKQFLNYVNQTGSPYHTVAVAKGMLLEKNFEELKDEQLPWSLKKGGKYFVTKDGSTLCAFIVGKQWDALTGGFVMVGTHTDSPCLRIRPNSKITNRNHLQIGVSTYGGGLWHTWFDRPLGFAGKVLYTIDGQLKETTVRVDHPVMLVPNLAIHLQTADERKAFAVNTENNLQPVMMIQPKDECKDSNDISLNHHNILLEKVAEQIPEVTDISQITDMDLCLFCTEPSRLIGGSNEFVLSGRIDNLASVFSSVQGMIDFGADEANVENSRDINLLVGFDHEECGSESAVGANGVTIEGWIKQILEGTLESGLTSSIYHRVMNKSFMASIDCAHALHPNYSAKHQDQHAPNMHDGIVIKSNANQRYATTALTSSLFKRVCKLSDCKFQNFVVRNDCPCGSTLGPMTSSNLGVRTIDIGIPQWAMHSVKETCSAHDMEYLLSFCTGIYKHFRSVDETTSTL